jgi:transcriptional regulator with XRE-family HTH domain
MPTPEPGPTPEGILIRRGRLASGMSVPEAAQKAEISVSRWNQLEAGYETRGGVRRPIRIPDGPLAAAALTVNVTPKQLADAERYEAAAVVEEAMKQRQRRWEFIPEDPAELAIRDLPVSDREKRALVAAHRAWIAGEAEESVDRSWEQRRGRRSG